ncbi:hypothetical protein RclHR1_37120001, partial [Rhizophagus clarus]
RTAKNTKHYTTCSTTRSTIKKSSANTLLVNEIETTSSIATTPVNINFPKIPSVNSVIIIKVLESAKESEKESERGLEKESKRGLEKESERGLEKESERGLEKGLEEESEKELEERLGKTLC